MNIIETKLQEFEKLKLEEYGKWRIDRNVAKDFLRQSMLEAMETVLEEAELPKPESFSKEEFEKTLPQSLILTNMGYSAAYNSQKQRHKDIIQSYKQ